MLGNLWSSILGINVNLGINVLMVSFAISGDHNNCFDPYNLIGPMTKGCDVLNSSSCVYIYYIIDI